MAYSTLNFWRGHRSAKKLLTLALVSAIAPTNAVHHMKKPISQDATLSSTSRPLVITNQCQDTIYPAIGTQKGTAPSTSGFELSSGQQRNLTVSADWQGRVWGRTNCTFNSDGTGAATNGGYNGGGAACSTGDCGGVVNCVMAGNPPATLAEFSLASYSGQTFYDISLVDGYNIPMGIVSLYPESGNASLTQIPPNLTNPVCIGTAALLADEGSTADAYLGTNSSFPIPLDQTLSKQDVEKWCPWDLQLNANTGPANGVYVYPDTSIQRPLFNPCYSACAKYSKPQDCCTGAYDNPNACKPSQYSTDAKKVCPDAYSFAFDDQTSTFIIPSGGGFEVVFCPPGRSTTILSTLSAQLHQLAATGHVTSQVLEMLKDEELVRGVAHKKVNGGKDKGNGVEVAGVEGGLEIKADDAQRLEKEKAVESMDDVDTEMIIVTKTVTVQPTGSAAGVVPHWTDLNPDKASK